MDRFGDMIGLGQFGLGQVRNGAADFEDLGVRPGREPQLLEGGVQERRCGLGEHIRKARMDKGLPTRELAALVGVSPDTIINWELRGVRPKENVLDRLGTVLQFSLTATGE